MAPPTWMALCGAIDTGTVNLWLDPGFADPGAGDYHLASTSQAIDAGVDTDLGEDVDGEARPFDGGPDIGFDEWATVETTAEPGGVASLEATVGDTSLTVDIPAGAVSQSTQLVLTAQAGLPGAAPDGYAFAGLNFDLDAYIGGALQPGFIFNNPVTITIEYSDEDVAGLDENSLILYYWDGNAWVEAACGAYEYHPAENWFSAPICHLSRFALFAPEGYQIFLPVTYQN
jgi:hypothetical protein